MLLKPVAKLVLTTLLLGPFVTTAQSTAIWIDTDIHLGRFGRDVDDGLALLYLLRSPQVEVKGIGLTRDIDHGYKVTQKLLQRCGKTISIYKGARSHKSLGKETNAVKALTASLQKEKLSILILGPATNIATVLLLHPELQKQTQEIVFCGGRQPGRLFSPARGRINLPDANFERDAAAFEFILATSIPVTLVGYEAACSLYVNEGDIAFLRQSPDKTDQWLYRKLRQWQMLWKLTLGSQRGFIPFDVVTAGWLMTPDSLLCLKGISVKTERLENDWKLLRLLQPKKPYLQASYDYLFSRKVHYCYGIKPGFKEQMLQAFKEMPIDTNR